MNIGIYLDRKEIFQYTVTDTKEIPFSSDVVDACRSNKCGKYGTCWTCPPGAGTPEELKEMILKYNNAAVFTCKYELEDWFDIEGMTKGARTTKNLLREISDKLKQSGEDFFALGCEGCNLCEKCTYPDSPCRFPDKAIISVEACGINVVELAQKIGINYHNGLNTVTYFCMILF